MRIVVDKRELRSSNIYQFLTIFGMEVIPKQLEIGDFIVSDDVAVERKTTTDFMKSVVDKRLFTQLKEMKRNYKSPVLIIEGPEDIYESNGMFCDSAIRGAVLSCVLDFQIPIIFSKSLQDTANYLCSLSRREQKEAKEFSLHSKKPKEIGDMQKYLMESLPMIGPKQAKTLLGDFGSPMGVFSAEDKELLKSRGVGKTKLNLMKKVLNEEWKNDIK